MDDSILQEIEKIIIDSCNGAMFEPSSDFQNIYATDLNTESLLVQLPMMPDVVRTANKDYKMAIQKITSVNTVCEIFIDCKFPKTINKLLQMYLTIPLTSALQRGH